MIAEMKVRWNVVCSDAPMIMCAFTRCKGARACTKSTRINPDVLIGLRVMDQFAHRGP